jgi:arginine-tRNA-protein transferase
VNVAWGADHAERLRLLSRALDRQPPSASAPFPCPYLPGREARYVHIVPTPLGPGVFHALMDLNFRRTGEVFYRTACEGCAECRTLRVDARAFRPGRAQRRCLARNADVAIEVGPLEPDEEKLALYQRYLAVRHNGTMTGSLDEFRDFLYATSVESLELRFRLDGRLIALSVVDVEPDAWNAVYCFYDPDLAPRSLGTLNVLTTIAECRRRGGSWVYLGYWVPGSETMDYKSRFRPAEVLVAPGRWQPVE